MREADRREIMCQREPERSDHLACEAWFSSPLHRYVARLGDAPVAAFGAAELRPGRKIWSAWAFGTDHMRAAIPAITRTIMRTITPDLLNRGAQRVQIYTIEDHDLSHRWLESMGCVREAVIPHWGKNGEAFVLYAWRRGDFEDV